MFSTNPGHGDRRRPPSLGFEIRSTGQGFANMKVRRGRKAVSVVFVASIATGGLVAAAGDRRVRAMLRSPPCRNGCTWRRPAPRCWRELAGVPIGQMPFDAGTDIISQDVRTISVDTPDGPIGCDTMTDKPVGVKDYDIDDCSRIQMDVSHGRLFMGTATQIFRDWTTDPDGAGGPIDIGDENPNDFEWRLPSGAIMDQFTGPGANEPNGHKLIHIVGTAATAQRCAGGARLHAGRRLLLRRLVQPRDAPHAARAGRSGRDASRRQGRRNPRPRRQRLPDARRPSQQVGRRPARARDAPTSSRPPTRTTTRMSTAPRPTPPVAEDPLPDGENSAMLLVGWLTCGQAIDAGTGFHFGSSIFQLDDPSLDDLLRDILHRPVRRPTYIDAALAALEAIKPGLSTLPFATSQPTTYTTAFGGISTMSEVQDALSEVTFLHNKPNDTCTLVTVVSDLGNNGLPIQYVGSPPTGVEIPFIGFDWNVLTITTGDLDEIHVNFDPTPLFFDESDGAGHGDRRAAHLAGDASRSSRSSGTPCRGQRDPAPGPGVAEPERRLHGHVQQHAHDPRGRDRDHRSWATAAFPSHQCASPTPLSKATRRSSTCSISARHRRPAGRHVATPTAERW